jgi:hypothetical protein
MTLAVNIAQSGSNNVTFRNKIINGAMVLDQRNAGAAVTYNGVEAVYNLDRFQAGAIGGGSFTVQQSTTAPTGFYYSQKYTVGTADTSLAATDRYSMYQYIEGYNVADLDFGLATAQTVTVSFWVQSSITGTFGVYLSNAAFSRSIPSTFTINAANTWEQKTVTFTGDTTGTWLKTNLTGLVLGVSFAMGSTYQGTANTWAATAYFTTSSQTNWMATSGNTFYLTGVQLEAGTTASPFEYRQYGTEFSLCQRYFQKCDSFSGAANTTTNYIGLFTLQQTMRTTPSIGQTGVVYISDYVANDIVQSSASASVVNTGGGGTAMCCFLFNYSGMTAFKIYFSRMLNSNYVTFSAEL